MLIWGAGGAVPRKSLKLQECLFSCLKIIKLKRDDFYLFFFSVFKIIDLFTI